MQWAIDGCNLPTPAFPLDRLARLYMKLAAAKADTAADTSPLARIYRAMTTYPELVAGEGRFCTLLMQAFDGALVGKVGADASYAIGVRRREATQGALGIAVKVEDGNTTVLYAIVAECAGTTRHRHARISADASTRSAIRRCATRWASIPAASTYR